MHNEDFVNNPFLDPSNPEATRFPRIDIRSLSQEAYNHIKRLILTGVFKDGEKIPEEKIANILNVSRTPIREALRQLEQYGLVEIKPRSYAKVRGVSVEESRQIASVRMALETLAIKTLLANPERINTEVLYNLANQAIEKHCAGNVAESYLLDSAFHLELARQSKNDILHNILERLDAKNQLVRIRSNLSSEKYQSHLAEHLQLIAYLAERDEKQILALLASHTTPRL